MNTIDYTVGRSVEKKLPQKSGRKKYIPPTFSFLFSFFLFLSTHTHTHTLSCENESSRSVEKRQKRRPSWDSRTRATPRDRAKRKTRVARMGIESGGRWWRKGEAAVQAGAGGLLAGRLAVKIEICTDSSMRGGERLKRDRNCSRAPRRLGENRICYALNQLASSRPCPPHLSCVPSFVCPSSFVPIFFGYEMSQSYEAPIYHARTIYSEWNFHYLYFYILTWIFFDVS